MASLESRTYNVSEAITNLEHLIEVSSDPLAVANYREFLARCKEAKPDGVATKEP